MVAQALAALLYLAGITGELAHDPFARAAFWDLLEDARYGFAETEEAMFIVRNADGTLGFIRWASSRMLHQAQWSAPIPNGVIAIAHTHPNRLPMPSLGDIRTALHSNIPVYVLTRDRIMKTIAGNTIAVVKGAWR